MLALCPQIYNAFKLSIRDVYVGILNLVFIWSIWFGSQEFSSGHCKHGGLFFSSETKTWSNDVFFFCSRCQTIKFRCSHGRFHKILKFILQVHMFYWSNFQINSKLSSTKIMAKFVLFVTYSRQREKSSFYLLRKRLKIKLKVWVPQLTCCTIKARYFIKILTQHAKARQLLKNRAKWNVFCFQLT